MGDSIMRGLDSVGQTSFLKKIFTTWNEKPCITIIAIHFFIFKLKKKFSELQASSKEDLKFTVKESCVLASSVKVSGDP